MHRRPDITLKTIPLGLRITAYLKLGAIQQMNVDSEQFPWRFIYYELFERKSTAIQC